MIVMIIALLLLFSRNITSIYSGHSKVDLGSCTVLCFFYLILYILKPPHAKKKKKEK